MLFLKNFEVPKRKNFAKNGFIGSVIPIFKKSLPFEPPKIAFKMIQRHFTLPLPPGIGLKPIECEGWRRHFSLIFLILLFTKPNIEVSGWLYQTKTHFTHIVYQPFLPPSFTLYEIYSIKCPPGTRTTIVVRNI